MDTKDAIYLDYAATTPIDPRVAAAMLPYFTDNFGNPSSIYRIGQRAEAALEDARERIAADLNCRPDEILFTSGGTESDNWALRGMAFKQRSEKGANHILVSPVEHPAVMNTARQLQQSFGFDVEFLPVDSFGRVDPEDVKRRLRPTTALVSVIFANNEIGTITPIEAIGKVCRAADVPFHTDAVQAVAHLKIDLQGLPIDLMSFGAHKMYGPKGVGGLFVRKGLKIMPILTGGHQESGLRSGTENVPYIIGLAKALRLNQQEGQARNQQMQPLRDHLIGGILETIPGSQLTGHPTQRLPNHASFVIDGVDGNELLMMLDLAGFACSSGSACKTGDPEPSEVLLALGIPAQKAFGSLRVTLGKDTTLDQIEQFLSALPAVIQKCRKLAH